jgi:hypothetical protein
MGTSTSSSGGKAGSPFDPAWLGGGDATGGGGDGDGDGAGNGGDGQNAPDGSPSQPAVAPSRRFSAARANVSAYLRNGGRERLRSAARGMVSHGMGGARRAASTMRRTAEGAGALGNFLSSARDASDARVVDWVNQARQQNLSADDLILQLVQEVLPDTGSIDDESLRNAAADALGALYQLDPNIDVFNLTDIQIHDVMAITIANDVCNRMDLQLGQTYEKLKYTPQQVQMYRKDVKEYVRAEVRVVMSKRSGPGLDPKRLAKDVLLAALEVFAS